MYIPCEASSWTLLPCMTSLVKVPPYSKLNFQGKIFFTQNWCNIPSQGHYCFPNFPVVDWFSLFIYIWVLTFPLEDCSEFGNFVITLTRLHVYRPRHCCGDWLTFVCFVLMIADHDLVKKGFGPMIADHDLVKKR
jgi:hypothetical protein